jgi:hypothetical protein
MTVQRIETDAIYNHEKYGEVLVTGIGKMYDEWSITGPKDDIESGNVLVYFYDDYDGYGGMSPMPLTETTDEFGKSITEKVREHDYIRGQ